MLESIGVYSNRYKAFSGKKLVGFITLVRKGEVA